MLSQYQPTIRPCTCDFILDQVLLIHPASSSSVRRSGVSFPCVTIIRSRFKSRFKSPAPNFSFVFSSKVRISSTSTDFTLQGTALQRSITSDIVGSNYWHLATLVANFFHFDTFRRYIPDKGWLLLSLLPFFFLCRFVFGRRVRLGIVLPASHVHVCICLSMFVFILERD